MEKLGFSPRQIQIELGIDPGNARNNYPLDGTKASLENVMRLAEDPAFGLKSGRDFDLRFVSLPGLYALSAPSVNDAINRLAMFTPHIRGCELHVVQKASYHEIIAKFDAKIENDYSLAQADIQLCQIYFLIKSTTEGRVTPRYIKVRRKRPFFDDLYKNLFDCYVRFSDDVNAIAFRSDDFLSPQITYNPVMDPFLMSALEDVARAMVDGTMTGKVRRFMAKLPALSGISLPSLASQLAVSERTLQRRLNNGGKTFASLVDEERFNRAAAELRRSSIDLQELADVLGYDSPASIYRAFKRWTGMSPEEFRRNYAASIVANTEA